MKRVLTGDVGHGVVSVRTVFSAPSSPSGASCAATPNSAPAGFDTSIGRIPTSGGSSRGWSRRTSASKSPSSAVWKRH